MVKAGTDEPELARRLVLHEARTQQTPGRELRDLGDTWLLFDPLDPEPFWNRMLAPMWPDDHEAFARRLDQAITLFATLDRLPHLRPLPAGGRPPDLAQRLAEAGFETVGLDRRMVLADPLVCLDLAAGELPPGLTVERHPEDDVARAGPVDRPGRTSWAADATLVLEEAFGVDPGRRAGIEADVMACVARPGCHVLMLRVDGEPVTVARRSTLFGGTYLSAIGTRPRWRRRGLGRLVTAIAVADGLAAGSEFVHLAVEAANERAPSFYARIGFGVVGDPVPDLLLR